MVKMMPIRPDCRVRTVSLCGKVLDAICAYIESETAGEMEKGDCFVVVYARVV